MSQFAEGVLGSQHVEAVDLFSVVVVAYHRVGLATSCLPIRETGNFAALEREVDEGFHGFLVDLYQAHLHRGCRSVGRRPRRRQTSVLRCISLDLPSA